MRILIPTELDPQVLLWLLLLVAAALLYLGALARYTVRERTDHDVGQLWQMLWMISPWVQGGWGRICQSGLLLSFLQESQSDVTPHGLSSFHLTVFHTFGSRQLYIYLLVTIPPTPCGLEWV